MSKTQADKGPARICADLEGLDSLKLESLAVFVFQDVRPLRGVAGYIDWRLCGALSRLIMAEHFGGRRSEHVLMPVTGTLNIERLFIFGLGPLRTFSQSALSAACGTAIDVMTKAGAQSLYLAQPAVFGREDVSQGFLDVTSRTIQRRLAGILVSPNSESL